MTAAAPLTRARGHLRACAIATEIVVGIAALGGGYGLLRDAEGMGAERAWLDGSPFSDYTVPGLALLVVGGGGLLAAAAIALRAPRRGPAAGGLMAIVLALWGVTETATIGWRGPQQLVLVAAFVAAPAVLLAAWALAERGRGGA